MSFQELVIDPDGDVCLRVRERGCCCLIDHLEEVARLKDPNFEADDDPRSFSILVSSKVLSVASPVFKAMLCGNFKEGLELSQSKALSVAYPLELPEDSAKSLYLLCKILHSNVADLPEQLDGCCLMFIARLADKFQCAPTLKYTGTLWLRDFLVPSHRFYPGDAVPWVGKIIKQFWEALFFAYTIDLPAEYSAIAWALVLYGEPQYPKTFADSELDSFDAYYGRVVCEKAVEGIFDERMRCRQALYEAMMAPLSSPWHTMTSHCMCAAKTVGVYVEALKKADVWPSDITEPRKMSIGSIFKVCNSKSLPSIKPSSYHCKRQSGAPTCPCRSEPRDSLMRPLQLLCHELAWRQHRVADYNHAFKPKNGDLCLDCIKFASGGQNKRRKKCRIDHDGMPDLKQDKAATTKQDEAATTQ
ncbi:hypothetical protein CONLIGDRAFT_712920 [Coniochaeta ligniaria NRRL 30616]|uniref:BTB domain-containing protein n=1 Tax=Coniochaeta ligniaria NRRL 30616 TaxID=1408157 RepID=A0A1J7IZD8_9PEZI|nr:hypothetical protein CONLIGDRAFT_712920 [Coniochaeta ligniaria NRRL 30616]